MADIWFYSDPHFFHENIIKFVDDQGHKIRPFESIDHMHEHMVEVFNGCGVKDTDHVWWLGDITFKYNGEFNSLIRRFKGHRRLVIGNHDKIWNPTLINAFDKAELWRGFKEHDFTCTHFPHKLDSLRDGHFNVHGHTHQNILEDRHYINVCVEPRNYCPVHLDQILMEIRTNR